MKKKIHLINSITKEELINKIKNKEDIIIDNKALIFNTGGGDSWYKSISQAFYNNENQHSIIRNKIYENLLKKSLL